PRRRPQRRAGSSLSSCPPELFPACFPASCVGSRIAPVLVVGNRNRGDFSAFRLRLLALLYQRTPFTSPARGEVSTSRGYKAIAPGARPVQGFLGGVVAVVVERATVDVDVAVVERV